MSDECRNKMPKEEIGSMVIQPVLYYDWVVPDFQNWANSKSTKDFCLGPVFVIQNTKFCFGWYPNNEKWAGKVPIWLQCLSDPPIVLNRKYFLLVWSATTGRRRRSVAKRTSPSRKDFWMNLGQTANLPRTTSLRNFFPTVSCEFGAASRSSRRKSSWPKPFQWMGEPLLPTFAKSLPPMSNWPSPIVSW